MDNQFLDITYKKFRYIRLDLSFRIPKVLSIFPSYQPMQKFLGCRSIVAGLQHVN